MPSHAKHPQSAPANMCAPQFSIYQRHFALYGQELRKKNALMRKLHSVTASNYFKHVNTNRSKHLVWKRDPAHRLICGLLAQRICLHLFARLFAKCSPHTCAASPWFCCRQQWHSPTNSNILPGNPIIHLIDFLSGLWVRPIYAFAACREKRWFVGTSINYSHHLHMRTFRLFDRRQLRAVGLSLRNTMDEDALSV